jgi:prefoldin beta subunit
MAVSINLLAFTKTLKSQLRTRTPDRVDFQTLQNELNEVKATLEELRKESDDTITYKTVGQVMFKVDKPKLVEELDDKEKTLEMRLASTSKQLQGFPEKLKELQDKIQLELGKQNLRLQ